MVLDPSPSLSGILKSRWIQNGRGAFEGLGFKSQAARRFGGEALVVNASNDFSAGPDRLNGLASKKRFRGFVFPPGMTAWILFDPIKGASDRLGSERRGPG